MTTLGINKLNNFDLSIKDETLAEEFRIRRQPVINKISKIVGAVKFLNSSFQIFHIIMDSYLSKNMSNDNFKNIGLYAVSVLIHFLMILGVERFKNLQNYHACVSLIAYCYFHISMES